MRDGWTPPATWPHATHAARRGQLEDRVLACEDGGRLHAQRWPDGSWTVHKDRHDPERDALGMLLHFVDNISD